MYCNIISNWNHQSQVIYTPCGATTNLQRHRRLPTGIPPYTHLFPCHLRLLLLQRLPTQRAGLCVRSGRCMDRRCRSAPQATTTTRPGIAAPSFARSPLSRRQHGGFSCIPTETRRSPGGSPTLVNSGRLLTLTAKTCASRRTRYAARKSRSCT